MAASYSDETIFALASGRGRAGVAVVRISGGRAADCLEQLSGQKPPPARQARLTALSDPASGEALDRALVLWFPAPNSFSGEDVVELHIHGGAATIGAVSRALGALPGVRPAEAGEFSLWAFYNGRMDLTAAEGLNDLVAAETEAQRRQALRQLEGALGERYEGWRAELVAALAYLEAGIDFADEELPENAAADALARIARLREEIALHLAAPPRGERVRAGFEVVILGAPNVGKSSLLNALAREDVAIVSEIAGTTRDIISVRLDIAGFAVDVLDTAGLRELAEGGDGIEAEGIRRALERATRADLRIVLVAAPDPEMPSGAGVDLERGDILVANKIDLVDDAGGLPKGALALSAKTGAGLEVLLAALEKAVVGRLEGAEMPAVTRERHRQALVECEAALASALQGGDRPVELLAEDVRLAARALGRVTGRVDVEDILDVVFSDFCIGK